MPQIDYARLAYRNDVTPGNVVTPNADRIAKLKAGLARVERRGDAVWFVEPLPNDRPGPDFAEHRVDSPADGQDAWYLPYLQ